MGRKVEMPEMDEGGVEVMIERLSQLPDLHMPHSLTTRAEPVGYVEKKTHLEALLRRDAAIFLERYGSSLTSGELQLFEVRRDDYEVNWHLKSLMSAINPTEAEKRSRAAVVRNRRLAYMVRLVQDGQYFSEEAMRTRSPLLHYEHVGQFQDPASRIVTARPGEPYSEYLIRQAEEASIQRRLREERVEAGIPVEDEPTTNIEEEESEFEEEVDTESEDEETDPRALRSGQARRPITVEVNQAEEGIRADAHTQRNRDVRTELPVENAPEDQEAGTSILSDAQLLDRMQEFNQMMQENFLEGLDSEHVDYARIDNDEALDDDWMPEITRDAEERYFEQD